MAQDASEGDGLAAEARMIEEISSQFAVVYFDTASDQIRADAVEALRANSLLLEANPDLVIQIEGHCDPRGSEAMNLLLGQRRAEAVKRSLVKSGIRADRIFTLSYGEAFPAAKGEDEASLAKSRRVEFRILSVN